MASELSKRSERVVAWRFVPDKLDGTKAEADAAKSDVRMSFIFQLFG